MTCANAAYRGDLEMLKWARDNDFPWDDYTCSSAAEGGELEALQWARKHGCPWNKNECMKYASAMDHTNVVDWIRSRDSD